MANVLEKSPEPEEQHFVFKSKYREDKVTLDKPRVELNPDGSKSVEGHKMAEFTRNTWSTDDPSDAEKMRTIIKNRLKKGAPVNIIETTDIEGPGRKTRKKR